jgi:diguanylate cyclase (GGDEF)-like protein
MELWIKRRLRSTLVPGGLILVAAAIVLSTGWIPLPPVAVNFFYHAIFLAAALLALRFHSRRILWSAVIVWLAHYGILSFQSARAIAAGPAQTAFEAVSIFIPLNFILLTLFPEYDNERPLLATFLCLLILEATFVHVFARPEQAGVSVLHYSFVRDYHLRLSQPALLLFVLAGSLLVVQLVRFEKTIDNGMLWSLVAIGVGLEKGASALIGTAYFGVAGLILASSIVENSYSLAYQDELTGLGSRRAFNEAIERLKPPYALAVVDIDHFKSINDTYGHDTGDQVLRLVASRLARVSGGGEAFRVGGEEFTILFRGRAIDDVLDPLELLRLEVGNASFHVRRQQERRKTRRASDRRMRARTRAKPPLRLSSTVSVTVSIGVAEYDPKLSVKQAQERADQALYQAKQGGRNRIVVAGAEKKARREGALNGQGRAR